jgi:hypothetical protein
LCYCDRLEAIECISSIFGKKDFLDSIVLSKKFAWFGKNNRLATNSLKNRTAKHSFAGFCSASCVDYSDSHPDAIALRGLLMQTKHESELPSHLEKMLAT